MYCSVLSSVCLVLLFLMCPPFFFLWKKKDFLWKFCALLHVQRQKLFIQPLLMSCCLYLTPLGPPIQCGIVLRWAWGLPIIFPSICQLPFLMTKQGPSSSPTWLEELLTEATTYLDHRVEIHDSLSVFVTTFLQTFQASLKGREAAKAPAGSLRLPQNFCLGRFRWRWCYGLPHLHGLSRYSGLSHCLNQKASLWTMFSSEEGV